MMMNKNFRSYSRNNCVVFRKTKENFGGLSNMASGYPIIINNTYVRTSEAIYQACRFPHSKIIQSTIIHQKSPMTAKMKSKSYYSETRCDWENVKINIMRWCLRLKLACNYCSFFKLLDETKNMDIVEQSNRDQFWGAVEDKNDTLIGMNVLGRLLMELREDMHNCSENELKLVHPLSINSFNLYGKQIELLDFNNIRVQEKLKQKLASSGPTQPLLPFDI